MSTVTEITKEADFNDHLTHLAPTTLLVLSFYAPWAAPCTQMNLVLTTLAQSYPVTTPPTTSWLSINAEELPDISETYDVSAVPYLVLLRAGKVLETVSGSDAAKVRSAIEKHASAKSNGGGSGYGDGQALPELQSSAPAKQPQAATKDLSSYAPTSTDPKTGPEYSGGEFAKLGTNDIQTPSEDLNTRLEKLTKAASVMLSMKGTPSAPQCGFSRQLVALLREKSVRYGFFNILADDEVRQGLKEYADWPTFPQLWVDGELVGGLDIVKEEAANDPDFLSDHAVKPGTGTLGAN